MPSRKKKHQKKIQMIVLFSILDVNSASMESLEDSSDTTPESFFDQIDTDPELRLLDAEPELWVKTVDKEVRISKMVFFHQPVASSLPPQLVNSLTENQIKKQEYIYELIMTEKNHCRTLKVIKKVFFSYKYSGCRQRFPKIKHFRAI